MSPVVHAQLKYPALNDPNWQVVSSEVVGRNLEGRQETYKVDLGKVALLRGGVSTQKFFFYTAYSRPTPPRGKRRLTFCFGGGPGSSSALLHLGGIGPVRIEKGEDGVTGPLVDNYQQSLLTCTDLVFIDPPGTGHSSEDRNSFGYLQDLRLFADFFREYLRGYCQLHGVSSSDVSVNFVGGSYGGLRAAGLAHRLLGSAKIDNLFLFAPSLDYSTRYPREDNDLPYVLALPTNTAIAHLHGKLPEPTQSLSFEAALKKAKQFAPEYAAALRGEGNQSREYIEENLWQLTGVSIALLREHKLRIPFQVFSNFHGVSSIDGRYVFTPGDQSPSRIDPYLDKVVSAFGERAQVYLTGLGNDVRNGSDLVGSNPYVAIESRKEWDWLPFKTVAHADAFGFLKEAMEQTPDLRVVAFAGLFDSSPPSRIEHFVDRLPQELKERFTTHVLPTGHMPYMDPPSLPTILQTISAMIEESARVSKTSF